MKHRVLLLLLPWLLVCAADPYADWAQGRPAEAVVPLIAQAAATQRWDAWLDAGLAAAAAGRRGDAIACLARSHASAPERPEPRNGLRALGAPLPATWCERAGPIGLPGFGWPGVAILAVAGIGLGLALGGSKRRLALLTGTGLLIVVAAPGQIAMHLDQAQAWACAVRDTQALDSTGAPLRTLAEGTLLRTSGRTWDQRSAVILSDGQVCWVPTIDLTPGR